ncbi:MAG: hypothetical protein J0L93_00305 [Deltaproteobacteria bacterium]|nr:hypothetical protein [Deltaproteobacteria bacterium]
MKSIFLFGFILLTLSGCGEDLRCGGVSGTPMPNSASNGSSVPLNGSVAIGSPEVCSVSRSQNSNPSGCTINQYTGKCD